ncbi:MAG TPA: hypothetical protein VGK96_11715 [Candidatus Sulfotelmatobacter sp.]|jgi:hypothetical protein
MDPVRALPGCETSQKVPKNSAITRFDNFIGLSLGRYAQSCQVLSLKNEQADGINVSSAVEQGSYLALNAGEALSTFMVNDMLG